ncbi:amidohydrolase family protein [Chryseolinea lacunae]|uniref:Amidohydrolase family protein n=1 Tax=Chryseolinea lacunae TaxID=2801331 RepID=A0ABS1KNC3_9BACT|nr:amidohydrolase family protein [Chryseolinea lacunae]MBL0740936.1 amidohydrolase family protein [Chryseolinea lacunae]
MNIQKILPLLFVLALACKSRGPEGESFTAYTGATIIDGSGAAPVENGVLLVREGHVVAVGTKENVAIPEHAIVHDVTGKTIVPGFINGHGHVGDAKGIEGGHYSSENIIDNLKLYAHYGITTVVSLGGDKAEAEPLRAANDTATTQHARLFIAGDIIHGNTPADARAVVDSNRHLGVDIIKIRVDDNLGTSPKMPEEIYRAAIARAHELGYKVATHLYYLDDARKLIDAGTDMLAHSVRDQPVDDAFVSLIKSKNVCYCPTLTRELSTYVYGDTAAFFKDPFFTRAYDTAIIRPLLDPARQQQVKTSKGAITYRQQLPVAKANLKTLCDQGVPIVFGTDSGVPTRFIGYFEHLEMEMMADAGLTPMQIIVSATKNAAESLGLKNLGTLSKGHWADFVIVDANPLDDIRNMRKINQVIIGGVDVKR